MLEIFKKPDTVYTLPPVMTGSQNYKRTGLDWYRELIDYDRVAELTKDYAGSVAVLDDTAKISNLNLIGKVEKIYEHTNEKGESGFHGHHVSGIVTSKKHGLFPTVKIGLFKVLSAKDGRGLGKWIVDGIQGAREEGYEVINASLGSNTNDPRIEAEVRRFIYDPKRFFVCASGNDSADTDYPAALSKTIAGVISVGAVEYHKNEYRIAVFSSSGAVTICAPGVDIMSTLPNDKEDYLTGTSMATPFISGLIAICKGIYPAFDHTTFDFVVRSCTQKVHEDILHQGYGLVNIVNFIEKVIEIAGGTVTVTPYPKVEAKVSLTFWQKLLRWLNLN